MFKDIVSSLMLISRIPLGFLRVKPENCQRAVIHFPIAGYASFALWYTSFTVFRSVFHDNTIPAVLSLVIVYYFFNLFHFDGFLDSIDGLLSQKPKEDVLKIMKAGNIGPTALFFGTIYLVLRVYLVSKIGIWDLLPVFVISRWGMSFAAYISKPAAETGLGSLIDFGKFGYIACSTIYLLPLFLTGKASLIGILIASVFFIDIIIAVAVERRIGGLTGDNFGLINEVNELMLMLIIFGVKP